MKETHYFESEQVCAHANQIQSVYNKNWATHNTAKVTD